MGFNQKDYNAGKARGLEIAWSLIENAEDLTQLKKDMAKEMQFRDRTKIRTDVTHKQLDEACEQIKGLCYETVLTMSLMVLHDEFDFGKKRLGRFLDRWMLKTDCLTTNLVEWPDMLKALEEEAGISYEAPHMAEEGWRA